MRSSKPQSVGQLRPAWQPITRNHFFLLHWIPDSQSAPSEKESKQQPLEYQAHKPRINRSSNNQTHQFNHNQKLYEIFCTETKQNVKGKTSLDKMKNLKC